MRNNVLQLMPHVIDLMPRYQGRHNHVGPEDASLLSVGGEGPKHAAPWVLGVKATD